MHAEQKALVRHFPTGVRTGEVVLPKTAARQGVTGHNVRYVLVISTVGAIVALTIAYYFVFS